jgi:dTDP-4-dehydrorhamnose reductase
MILLYGSTGYIGSAIAAEMDRRKVEWKPVPWQLNQICVNGAKAVINCAAFIPKSSVAVCDQMVEESVEGNILFPARLSGHCYIQRVPLIHFSTGCLFDDKRPYSEIDTPTRGLNDYCGTYVTSKLLAEKALNNGKNYILRIRLPFDNIDHPRNYLSKLMRYPEVWDHVNSLSHRGDIAKATLDLIEAKAAPGIYNMVNPDGIGAREIVTGLISNGLMHQDPEFVAGPVNGCVLTTGKIEAAGVNIRTVREALNDSIQNWKTG